MLFSSGEVSLLCDVELIGFGETDMNDWITFLKLPASESFVKIKVHITNITHDCSERIDQVLRVYR
jgi:hypothetical protein